MWNKILSAYVGKLGTVRRLILGIVFSLITIQQSKIGENW